MERKFINLKEKNIPIVLLNKDIGEYTIIVPSDSHIYYNEKCVYYRAARQLQKYLAYITGKTIYIQSSACGLEKDNEIVFGVTNRNKFDAHKNHSVDEYEFYSKENKLYFLGGKRGIFYGVFEFLEKYCGVRFFTADIEMIYNRDKIDIANLQERYLPPLEYREMSNWNSWDSEFSVKSKLNGLMIRQLGEEWGGGIGYVGGVPGLVHTFSLLMPPEKYFDTHPEYFALNEKGDRDPTGMCFTNKETHKIVLKNILSWLKENPEGTVSLSVNDGPVAYCQCEECKKIEEEEESLSGSLIRFVNSIAEEVEKVYPKATVDTLIYGQLEKLPKKVKPRQNVVLRITSTATHSYSLLQYKNNPIGKNDKDLQVIDKKISDWGKLGKIYVWDYPVPYRAVNGVHPSFHIFLDNIRFYCMNNAKGIYINGNSGDSCQFSEMTTYLLAKCLYRPMMSQKDFETHMSEFLEGFYGAGWTYIRGFIDYTLSLAQSHNFHCFSAPYEIIVPDELGEQVCTMRQFFENARLLANEAERYRLERAELQIEYYDLFCNMEKQYALADKYEKSVLVNRNKVLYENLKKHSILRLKNIVFMPIVKDFRQAPCLWDYWDPESVAGDRNNTIYDRDMYAFLETDLTKGTVVNLTFSLMTNNTSKHTYCEVFAGENSVVITDENGENIDFVWDEFRDYKTVKAVNVVVTDKEEYLRVTKNKIDRMMNNIFLPLNKNCLMLKISKLDAGAFYMIKNVKICCQSQ